MALDDKIKMIDVRNKIDFEEFKVKNSINVMKLFRYQSKA